MGRAGGLVLGAVIAGLALTFTLVSTLDPPRSGASAPPIAGVAAVPDDGDAFRRCRTATEADAGCEAAWEAKRRHFFGTGKDGQ